MSGIPCGRLLTLQWLLMVPLSSLHLVITKLSRSGLAMSGNVDLGEQDNQDNDTDIDHKGDSGDRDHGRRDPN